MKNSVARVTAPAPSLIGDGFNDVDDASSLIKGGLIKFTNSFEWTIRGNPAPKGLELVVCEVHRVQRKWLVDASGKLYLADFHILAEDEKFPTKQELDAMNEACPKTEWRWAFGKHVGPWENCIYVYLLEPKTFTAYTFPSTAAGAHVAYKEMKDATRRARLMEMKPNLYPVITLGDAPWSTNYGMRQRPAFNIVRFIPIALPGLGTRPGLNATDEPTPPEQITGPDEDDERIP